MREPIGVCGQIIPWHYPLLMASWTLAPGLAAGNCCILKPSELTPLSAVRIFELIDQVGFPPGVAQLVLGLAIRWDYRSQPATASSETALKRARKWGRQRASKESSQLHRNGQVRRGAAPVRRRDLHEWKGNFVQPTVFANTRPAMNIVREEIFGPVLVVQLLIPRRRQSRWRTTQSTAWRARSSPAMARGPGGSSEDGARASHGSIRTTPPSTKPHGEATSRAASAGNSARTAMRLTPRSSRSIPISRPRVPAGFGIANYFSPKRLSSDL